MTAQSQIDAAVWLPLLREALDAEGRFRFPLRGNSMRPTLPAHCEIDVTPLAGRPRLGELIVFVVDDALVAHRLVRRRGDVLIAQGDNRLGPDRPLLPDQVLGRVAELLMSMDRKSGRKTAERLAAWFWITRYHALEGRALDRAKISVATEAATSTVTVDDGAVDRVPRLHPHLPAHSGTMVTPGTSQR